MKVILISGKARSGKDQSALFIKEYIENELNQKAVIIKYGDFLKNFLERSLCWDGRKDEYGRHMLQTWGTDIIRENYQYAFTDMMIALLRGICTEFDYTIICDARFPNEVEEIEKFFQSITLRVVRDDNNSNLTSEQKQHTSETAMDNYDFDAYIYNKFDLNALKSACCEFCNTYLVR
jgi:hypothetical protein